MPVYRFYFLDSDGYFVDPAIVVEFPNDRRAIQAAQELLDQKAVEVWHLARVVIRLYPKHPE
jgi:hypothetical protein